MEEGRGESPGRSPNKQPKEAVEFHAVCGAGVGGG